VTDEPHALDALVDQFLLSRRARNCTARTLAVYEANLRRFAAAVDHDLARATALAVQGYLAALRAHLRPVSVHQHYRTLRTFFAWAVAVGALARHPLAGVAMRAPKTLPRVPEDDAVRRLLAACPATVEGHRNRAMVALLADSGLRKEELRRLRLQDLDLARRLVCVRAGKGQKDGIGFMGDRTARLVRRWLAVHPAPHPEAPVWCDRGGAMLGPSAVVRILHRLSRRAGLARPVGPHALRHYAATSLMRATGDLDLVRRVLRHETLAMTLRYAALTQTEVAAKFAHASPLDTLCAPARVPHPFARARP
jgi:site-specific recombinase XerD